MTLKEFFGFGGYERPAEGYFSWQHLLFVSCLMLVMVLLAICFGRRLRKGTDGEKNRVLIVAAILIDSLEIFKIVLLCIRHEDPLHWTTELPLFLCSIQLIAIPMAAFAKGRLKSACLDFVTIFGLLGAVMGTYFAGQNYGTYPVLSFDNVVSGVTHSISGFCALYVMLSGMVRMHRRDIPITVSILGGFCVAAYVANFVLDYNYMFLRRGDGTPYDILFNLVNGNQILYPLLVVLLFVFYIAAFYEIYYAIARAKQKKREQTAVQDSVDGV